MLFSLMLHRLDVAKPDVAKPDIAQPDIAQPDIAQPDIAKPDIAQPDIAKPDISQPDPLLHHTLQKFNVYSMYSKRQIKCNDGFVQANCATKEILIPKWVISFPISIMFINFTMLTFY